MLYSVVSMIHLITCNTIARQLYKHILNHILLYIHTVLYIKYIKWQVGQNSILIWELLLLFLLLYPTTSSFQLLYFSLLFVMCLFKTVLTEALPQPSRFSITLLPCLCSSSQVCIQFVIYHLSVTLVLPKRWELNVLLSVKEVSYCSQT